MHPLRRETIRFFACSVAAGTALALAVLFSFGSAQDGPASQVPGVDQAALKLLKTFNDEFVKITPGEGRFPATFRMGSAEGPESERPVHEVRFQQEFAIAKYEVPQNLYKAVTRINPSVWKGPGRERNSVETVTFHEAVLFCRQATSLMRLAKLIGPEEEIRLPTEAEWEYCCRAGTTTTYSFGDSPTRPGDEGNRASRLDAYGWHVGNAGGKDPAVGALKPNAWGLYDMHGYLWEYVADAWHDDYTDAPAENRSWDGERKYVWRIIRGGSWRDRYEDLRSSTRKPIPDHVRSDAIGFRCVKAGTE